MPWQTLAFFNFNLINFYIYFNHQTHVFFDLKSSRVIFYHFLLSFIDTLKVSHYLTFLVFGKQHKVHFEKHQINSHHNH